jgi:hypothetical protein
MTCVQSGIAAITLFPDLSHSSIAISIITGPACCKTGTAAGCGAVALGLDSCAANKQQDRLAAS